MLTLSKHQNEPMCISVISYGELIFGAKKSKSVEKNLATVQILNLLFPS